MSSFSFFIGLVLIDSVLIDCVFIDSVFIRFRRVFNVNERDSGVIAQFYNL